MFAELNCFKISLSQEQLGDATPKMLEREDRETTKQLSYKSSTKFTKRNSFDVSGIYVDWRGLCWLDNSE
jgi:hypothetical protein